MSKKVENMAERFLEFNQRTQMEIFSPPFQQSMTRVETPSFHPYIRRMSTQDIISALKEISLIKVLNRKIYISQNTIYHSCSNNELYTIIEKIIIESRNEDSEESLDKIIDAVIKDPQLQIGYHCPVDRKPTTGEQNKQNVWDFIEQTYEWGTEDDIVLSADAYSCYQKNHGSLNDSTFMSHFSSLAKLYFQADSISSHVSGVRGMRKNAENRP